MKKFLFLLTTLSLIFSTDAQAFGIKHDFTVFLGPFNASHTEFTYRLSPTNYEVKSDVKTAGIFDTLYPFRAEYATTGRIKDNDLETTSYKYKSQSRFNRRSKELIYDQQGNPIYRLSSKNDKTKKVEILPDIKNRDTTDLQTVIAELARQYNKVKFCDARLQVFDGKRRFDVIFKDEGQEQLTANEYSPYQGLAAKCSMYIDKLGAKGDDLLWELTSDRPIYFWILQDPKSQRPFIARVYIEQTPLGALNVYTKNITLEN